PAIAPSVGPSVGATVAVGGVQPLSVAASPDARPPAPPTLPVEGALGLVWLLSSLVMGTAILLSVVSLERQRGRWRHHVLAGRSVWVTDDIGPAVVGFLWTDVLVPAWVLRMDPEAQTLLVRHEEEHERAGDPYLLLLATVALVLVPWNPGLWWQVRRLRLAVEVDCDARVLRDRSSLRTYGRLLIEVGRVTSRTLVPIAPFSRSRSLLERRIRILAGPEYRPRATVLLALTAIVVLAPAAVAAIPAPRRPALGALWRDATDPGRVADPHASAPVDPEVADPAREPTYTAYEVRPQLRNPGELAQALEGRYVAAGGLPGTAAPAVVWTFVDESGIVVNTRLVRSSGDPLLDRVAQEALRESARFVPARDRGRRTAAWIQLPLALGAAEDPPREETYRLSIAMTPPPRPPVGPDAAAAAAAAEPARLLDPPGFARLLGQSLPAELKGRRMGGTAVLWVFVEATGTATYTRLARSSGHAQLDLVAGEVVRQARFAPARRRDLAIDSWIQLPVTLLAR
ncbi:MAG TPA: M56 family metallopeptidase, partial [Longimicrobiaceae bacterium]